MHKAWLVKFHRLVLVTQPWQYPGSISAVDGTVSKAECSNKNQYSINTLFKQKVGTLISSQTCFYWFFSFFKSLSFLFQCYKMDIIPFIWKAVLFFMLILNHLMKQYHAFSCKPNAIVKQFIFYFIYLFIFLVFYFLNFKIFNTWKDAQHHSLLEKCKSKPQWGTTSHQSEWLRSKNL